MPLHMRLPKLRGFKNPFRTEYQVVNLDKLAALYPEGGQVTVEDLVAKGAVRKGQLVKVLGTGEITVKLEVAVDALSGARARRSSRPAVRSRRTDTPGQGRWRVRAVGPVRVWGRLPARPVVRPAAHHGLDSPTAVSRTPG